ncbi:MAG: alpha/beta hydrolase [Deltaproteobacteria bacterium]|nr:alpha/beta hydrolase [Deltaproteobacteria bacterium]
MHIPRSRITPITRFFGLSCALLLLACRAPTHAPDLALRVQSSRQSIGAISLRVVEVGQSTAPPCLVLHGGPGLDHAYLRVGLDPLARRGVRLVYVDLRGHGQSDAPPDASGYTISAAAGDLESLLRAQSVDRPVDVIAHDFGAAIAMEFARTHPERVRRMVLIAPIKDGAQLRAMSARTQSALGRDGAQIIASLSTPQGTLRDARRLGELIHALGPLWWAQTPTRASVDELMRSVHYRAEADQHFLLQLSQWDSLSVAREVRAETLVLSGAQDRTFLPAESHAIADQLAHGRFALIERAGHLPMVEQRDLTNTAIAAFLQRNVATPTR